jgi:hypothetical protein
MFELFLTKILKTNLDSAGQTIFLGEWNVTSIFLLKNLATPSRAVALRPCEAPSIRFSPRSAFFPPAGGVWGGMRAGF